MKNLLKKLSQGIAVAAVLFTVQTTVEAAGAATQPSICSRSCWSARSASANTNMSALNRAIIHHTAVSGDYNTTSQSTSASKVRAIQNYHMDTNGWSDIGYHFLFDKLGNAFEGRYDSLNKSVQRRGAHDGNNTNSFGFTALGYYHPPYNNAMTTATKNKMYQTIAWRMPNGYSPYGAGSYNGNTVGYLDVHRDVKATACPGDVIYNGEIGTNHNAGNARAAINNFINPPAATEVIVDNTSSGFSSSANWWTSSSTAGYYGSNYAVRSTELISDTAKWTVNLPSSGNYTVYARWTAGTNRASSATYSVTHNGGTTNVVKDQTANNGSWQSLGTFGFSSGSALRVQLSCWTSSGDVVIADAVRFVKQ